MSEGTCEAVGVAALMWEDHSLIHEAEAFDAPEQSEASTGWTGAGEGQFRLQYFQWWVVPGVSRLPIHRSTPRNESSNPQ